jgi:hypothetical protein
MIKAVPPAEDAERPSIAAVFEGFRYARSRQELIGTYIVDFVAMVVRHAARAVSGHFGSARRTVGARPAVRGAAVGALAAGVTGRWVARVPRHGLGVMVAAAIWGVAIVFFGFCSTLWPALASLAIAGGADA